MKLIHTADWHIGRTLNQYPLLEDQRHFLTQLTDYAVENRVDAIIIAGDLYNRAVPSAQAVQLLDGALSRLVVEHGIRVIAIAGNHDSPERLSFCSEMLESCGLHIAGMPSARIRTVELGGAEDSVVIHLLPYFTAQQIRETLADTNIATENDAFAALMAYNRPFRDRGKTNILAAHGFFSRLSGKEHDDVIFSQSELSVGALDIMDITHALDFDYVALGHLHAPQRAGADNARYAGSPLKYAVSEWKQRKSVTLIETGRAGIVSVSEHEFAPLRDLHLLEDTFDRLMDNVSGVDPKDYVFASILGGDAILYAMQKLRTVYPYILGLNFASPQGQQTFGGTAAEISAQDVEALFEEFYARVMGEGLTPLRKEMIHALAREQEETGYETPAS